jgi:hypothetical protein
MLKIMKCIGHGALEGHFDDMLKIMKCKGHGALEGHFDVFKTEMHFPVCKGTPRTSKRHLVLILGFDMNLIIP